MKLTRVYPTIELETDEEQSSAGRYNPGQVAIYQGHRFALDAGRSDNVSCYTEGNLLYVLSTNTGLDYVGMQEFYLTGEYAGDEAGSIFLQTDSDIRETFEGSNIEDLSDRELIRKLAEYIY